MPRRAILSVLVALAGTLGASAAPLGPAVRNMKFQPRAVPPSVILRPADTATLRPTVMRPVVMRPAVSKPARIAINPAASGRGP